MMTRRGEGNFKTLELLLVSFIGLAVFSKGFFPVKPLLPGFRSPIILTAETPPFSRLVFIVIDALRSDFAFGPDSKMDFVSTLIDSGNALPFTAIASAPTVTLPRLKAMTSGSNPTFVDAILNIAEDASSVLENVDTWIRQLAFGSQIDSNGTARRKIVFVGDDTWLRLFPQRWFSWREGVTSFFVSDTETVDFNVTRYLSTLLSESNKLEVPFKSDAPSDWDVLILHFLGLDHVGHLAGSKSLLMAPKQVEMDSVIRRIYIHLSDKDAIDGERSLIVVVGDHGMTDMGNHGGSTEGETSAALLFITPSFQITPVKFSKDPNRQFSFYERVNQIDLVPTLSALMGLGIPSNSMGQSIVSVLEKYGGSQFCQEVLSENVEQLSLVLDASNPGSVKEFGKPKSKIELLKFLSSAQERLLSTFGDYHMTPMLIGLIIMSLVSVVFGFGVRPAILGDTSRLVPSISVAFVLYLGSLFATSFIEEEHEYWYFISSTLCLLLAASHGISTGDRLRMITLAGTIRIMRDWSKNGQKDIPNISISSYLASAPQVLNYMCVSILFLRILVSFRALVDVTQSSKSKKLPPQDLFFRALSFAVLLVLSLIQIGVVAAGYASTGFISGTGSWYHTFLTALGIDGSLELARVGYGVSLVLIAVTKSIEYTYRDLNLDSLKLSTVMILLISITRSTNIPLFFLLWSQYKTITPSIKLSPLSLTALIVCLQHVSFFAFGGSNSLATIDLSQAYNGISSYDVRFVSLLTFLSNFSGPIFWSLATPSIISTHQSVLSKTRFSFSKHYTLVSAFHSISLVTLALSATHFRRHLFTWTVFSPAILYKGVWSVLIGLGCDFVLAYII